MTTTPSPRRPGAPSTEERPDGEPRPGGAARATSTRFAGFGQRYALVFIAIILLAVCIIAIPQFRSLALITTMVNSQSILLLLALAATVSLRTGVFDLSIAQVMIASAVMIGVLSGAGVPPPLAGIIAVIFGSAIGVVNGLLVVRVGVDSFIVTLGMFTALAGLSLLLSGSKLVTTVPDEFTELARTPVLGMPLATWFAWILAAILWFVYQRTPLGRYMLFVGGNPTAARLSGVRVDAIRLGTFIASGALAAFTGVIYAGYFGSVDPSIGGQYMLQPFAAAFLGSTAIAVGRFNAIGTIVALYLLTIGITGLQLLGAQTWVTSMFYGVALIVAVTAAKLAGTRRGRRPRVTT